MTDNIMRLRPTGAKSDPTEGHGNGARHQCAPGSNCPPYPSPANGEGHPGGGA